MGSEMCIRDSIYKGLHRGYTQADGSLFHAHIHLLQECTAGTDGIRQLADNKRNDHDHSGTGQDHRLFVEGNDQADTEDSARNDKREHDQKIHELASQPFLAHDDVRDQHAQDDNEHDRDRGEYEGVADIGPQTVEDRCIAVQTEALLESGKITFDKESIQRAELLDTICLLYTSPSPRDS